MDLGPAGRAAAVTESSQGIGRATALLFGSEGARVAVTYHRERDRALAVVDEIENGGGEAVATELDLASTGSVSRAVGTALEGSGHVDQRASRRVVPAARSGQHLTLAGYAILFGFLAARCFRWE